MSRAMADNRSAEHDVTKMTTGNYSSQFRETHRWSPRPGIILAACSIVFLCDLKIPVPEFLRRCNVLCFYVRSPDVEPVALSHNGVTSINK